jgi:hypothetical protein
MAKAASPSFSVVILESGWFRASYAMQKARGKEALIGPFPSQDEAEKDARETLDRSRKLQGRRSSAARIPAHAELVDALNVAGLEIELSRLLLR